MKKATKLFIQAASLVLVANLLLASCGGNSDGSSGTPPPPGTLVKATAGGTVSSGNASLTIPAKSLTADTRITESAVSSGLPAAPSGKAVVTGTTYDIGPNGTAFGTGKPATLTIKYDPTKLPSNVPESSLALYTLTNGAWQPVSGSAVDTANNKVTASLAHLSTYGLLGSITTSGGSGGYTITVIPPLSGDGYFAPRDLNDSGIVVGTSKDFAGGTRYMAAVWDGSSTRALGKQTGDDGSEAVTVNSKGDVGGEGLTNMEASTYALLFQAGRIVSVKQGGYFRCLNSRGDYVINFSAKVAGQTVENVQIAPGNVFRISGKSHCLSDNGVITGETDSKEAAIWLTSGPRLLGRPSGFSDAQAEHVSLDGTRVLGVGTDAGGNEKAFVYNGGFIVLQPLPGFTATAPTAINNAGVVIGASNNGFGTPNHVCMWKNAVAIDLAKSVLDKTGWTVEGVTQINNKGQILATGRKGTGGQFSTFLITPIP